MTNKSSITAVLLLASFSLAQAAEPMRWDDLSTKVWDRHNDREYRVVTKDGTVHKGYELSFNSVGVKASPSEPIIPRDQVKEIRIHRIKPLNDVFFAPSDKIFDACGGDDGWGCLALWPLLPVLVPVALGSNIAAAPITLPIEGIKHLIQDKSFKVAP